MEEQKQEGTGTPGGAPAPAAEDGTVRLRIYAWWIGIAAVIFVLLSQAWQIRSLRTEMGEAAQAAAKELESTKDDLAKERLVAAAEAFASGIEPLMYLRNRGGEITDEHVRQVTTNLGQKEGFSRVVVLDSAGMIVATTDTTMRLGSRYPTYKGPAASEAKNDKGKWEVHRPVSSAGNLGSVVLVDR
ncbi:MAG: hypothetical protein AB1725_10445 [Armatimonadota bacterium]